MAFGYRKIPTRIEIIGDKSEGEKYYGLARKMMLEMENSMQFQNLKQLSRFWKDQNATIECWHGFGQSMVRITVTGGSGGKARPRKKQECFCLPCFAHGYITAVTYDDPCSYYGVEVCQKEEAGASSYKGKWISPELGRVGTYVLFTGVLALDYGIYEVGQPVLVSLVPCIAGAGCGCDSGYNMCTLSAIPVGDWPCSVAISSVHLEDAEGNYWSIPKWKTVERKWGALY